VNNRCRYGQDATNPEDGEYADCRQTTEESTELGHFNLESTLYEGRRLVAKLSYVYRPPRGTLAGCLTAASTSVTQNDEYRESRSLAGTCQR
jgi:hypothetical protein